MKMWTFQNLLIILCTAFSFLPQTASVIQVFGYEGKDVEISCSYGRFGTFDEKYFSKDEDVLITTKQQRNNRYSISDDEDKRIFTVTISDLKLNDTGIYWCSLSMGEFKIFTKVKLTVIKELCRVKSSIIRGIVGRPVTFQCSNPSRLRDKEKFFCKGDQLNYCTDMMANPTKFRLQQLSSSCFSVTITELEAGDAGRYYCGPDSLWSLTHYTTIQLEVVYPHESSTVSLSTMTGHVTSPPSPYL